MRYLTDRNVFEAAERRLDWLFEEFERPVVSFSGGKDSTVVLNLTLAAARRAGRLPLDVMFIDQEAEWGSVIDYMRSLKDEPDIRLHWMQFPLRISNAASERQDWLQCWDPGVKDAWIRPREPDSIHENHLGTKMFKEIFPRFAATLGPSEAVCNVAGVRCEESPARRMGLTRHSCYKWVTWGNMNQVAGYGKLHTFYPIYDWMWRDVWKAIHDNGWRYCSVYDQMYSHGVPITRMRVSSFCHETAVGSFDILHEFEPDTWAAVQQRLAGANGARHLNLSRLMPSELPAAFENWLEYREYLLANLVEEDDKRALFRRWFNRPTSDGRYFATVYETIYLKACVRAIILNDYHSVTLKNTLDNLVRMRRNDGVA